MANYFKVIWHHRIPDEPTVLYSEVVDGREIRKVEEYFDGTMDFADESGQTGTTFLSESVFPVLQEIVRDPQFTPMTIGPGEFEDVWRRAMKAHGAGDDQQ